MCVWKGEETASPDHFFLLRSQDAFGKHVNNPPLTKLPVSSHVHPSFKKCVLCNCPSISSKASLFEDLTPGGALCHIMTTAYRMKTEQSWYAILDSNCVPMLPYTSYCTHGQYRRTELE